LTAIGDGFCNDAVGAFQGAHFTDKGTPGAILGRKAKAFLRKDDWLPK
jgi:hypothetical protein